MGRHKSIAIDKFPKQGDLLGKRVMVCFHYNTKDIIHGIVVRDDTEEPYRTIIKLDDGLYVLATECMYSW